MWLQNGPGKKEWLRHLDRAAAVAIFWIRVRILVKKIIHSQNKMKFKFCILFCTNLNYFLYLAMVSKLWKMESSQFDSDSVFHNRKLPNFYLHLWISVKVEKVFPKNVIEIGKPKLCFLKRLTFLFLELWNIRLGRLEFCKMT